MATKMRFRTDSWNFADRKAAGETFEQQCCVDPGYNDPWLAPDSKERKWWEATPKAEPGDVWRVKWSGTDAIAGYAICCISCGRVHHWTTANNCKLKYKSSHVGTDGKKYEYMTCPHSGTGSCWNWTGSAEEGTLSATPSLQVIAHNPGECAWHGYITNGEIK